MDSFSLRRHRQFHGSLVERTGNLSNVWNLIRLMIYCRKIENNPENFRKKYRWRSTPNVGWNEFRMRKDSLRWNTIFLYASSFPVQTRTEPSKKCRKKSRERSGLTLVENDMALYFKNIFFRERFECCSSPISFQLTPVSLHHELELANIFVHWSGRFEKALKWWSIIFEPPI